MSFFGSRSNREGAGLPLPEGGFRRYTAVLGTNFWKLIGLNFLLLLFSLPVVTLPAALCGANRVCMLLIRNGYCFLWDDFWQEFRRSFKRSLLPGLLFAALIFAGYYFMSLGLTNDAAPAWSAIFWAIGMAATAAGLCWGGYFFALLSLLEQDTKGILKNAGLLCLIRPLRASWVLLIILVAIALLVLLLPLSVFLLFFLPVVVQFTVCFLVNTMAENFILKKDEA